MFRFLSHPLTRDKDIDSPGTTDLRREIIRSKPFLKSIYNEWYSLLLDNLPVSPARIIEIGSGAGFFSERDSRIISTDLLTIQGIDAVLDAQRLPVESRQLAGIAMVNVLHHVPNVTHLFNEAVRTLAPGGKVVMIEPWLTPWSRWVYTHLHHEPIDDLTHKWELHNTGPLSGANGALPWILFSRDLETFRTLYPDLEIEEIRPIMPFRYLLSGGISMRNLMPVFTFGFWRAIETILSPLNSSLAMFAFISLRRR